MVFFADVRIAEPWSATSVAGGIALLVLLVAVLTFVIRRYLR